MTDDNYRDPGGPRQGRRPARPLHLRLRLLIGVAVAVFAASLAFVLAYATPLPPAVCILIALVLAGAQVYTLRYSLFPGDAAKTGGDTAGTGDDTEDPDGSENTH